jgi:hypothetical protein
MKKLFLLLAFTGIVAASSASTIASFTKGSVITLGDEKKGDEKKKKEEKKSCDKDHACCKKDAKAGTANGKTEAKSCCKKTGASASTTTEKK